MHSLGASHVIFKLLANNDNSKQQVYFGGDFDVLRMIPHGELEGTFTESDGVIFKASLKLSWLSEDLQGTPSRAPNAQLIYYPRYPEVRMSGFLRGSQGAPNLLMQAPTPEERLSKLNTPRCLVLGICPDGEVIGYVARWGSLIALDATRRIESASANRVASVFFELRPPQPDSRQEIINRLSEIVSRGPIESCRLDANGNIIPYVAINSAGYTLESLFGITPNGYSEPDFKGWELKAHSGGALTLMTPEPDNGLYLSSLTKFLDAYGVISELRRDFTGRHLNEIRNQKTSLALTMEGYDPKTEEIIDADGGLTLRDPSGALAAKWSFNKLLTHWSKKHSQTAYITYKKFYSPFKTAFQYGPEVLLCSGAEVKKFLSSLHRGVIYYDPGINQKYLNQVWKAKKRNQFRVSWKNVALLYTNAELIRL